MSLRVTVFLVAIIVALLCHGCRSDQRVEEARLRKLDSLRSVVVQDSLREFRINSSLREPLGLIDEPRLDSLGTDCFRLIAVFSWGASPVGPMLSIRGCREDSTYIFTTHTFPSGKDPNDLSQRRRRQDDKNVTRNEFLQISNLLDSLDFENVPTFLELDYSVLDATEYYIERIKNGRYRCIVRASDVDPFVYRLFAAASGISGLPTTVIEEFNKREAEAISNTSQ
jgi:hypothetical protein